MSATVQVNSPHLKAARRRSLSDVDQNQTPRQI